MSWLWDQQVNSANSAATTTVQITFTIAGTRSIGGMVKWGSSTGAISSISDGTNTYTVDTGSLERNTDNGHSAQGFYFHGLPAGTYTITVTFDGAYANKSISLEIGSGLKNQAPLASKGNFQVSPVTAGTDVVTDGPMTIASQPAVILAWTMSHVGASPVSAGTGFTDTGAISNYDSMQGDSSRTEYQRVTATGNWTATFTSGGTSDEWDTVAMIFAEGLTGPNVDASPTDQVVRLGGQASFTGAYTTSDATAGTWQWQDDSSGSFADITGASGSGSPPTLTVSPVNWGHSKRRYRFSCTDANGTSYSSAATLLVFIDEGQVQAPSPDDDLGTFQLLNPATWHSPFGELAVEKWVADELVAASGGGGSGTSLTAGAGTLTITGYAPAISQPQSAAPGVASLTLSGFAPSVSQPNNVAPGVGSLTLSGFSPSVGQPQSAAPGVATLTLSGYAPAVGQPQSAAPGAAPISLTGYAPAVGQPQSAAPGVASVVLTGYAPSITQSSGGVFPDVGTLALSGYAPSISQPQSAAPGVGSVALSGFSPSVSQPISAAPGVATLSLSGFAPSIGQPQSAAPGAASVALSGYAPAVTQPGANGATPDVSAVALQGYAPSITQGVTSSGPTLSFGGGNPVDRDTELRAQRQRAQADIAQLHQEEDELLLLLQLALEGELA